jgi:hypothetical protein
MRAWLAGGKAAVNTLREEMDNEWEDLLREQPELYVATIQTTYARKAFMTSQGYIGLGPGYLAKGDVVCILFGGTVPFILRAQQSDYGGYRVVGEAYVHGIMDGEYMERNPETKDFKLY